jgi:hypothetical protein
MVRFVPVKGWVVGTMGLLNQPGEGGVIKSETLNLTRITAIAGAFISVVIAAAGVGARATDTQRDIVGFTRDERLVIIVAVVAAAALVVATDLIARAIATAGTNSAGIVTVGPIKAEKKQPTSIHPNAHVDGQVIAIRSEEPAEMLFYAEGNGSGEWVPEEGITLTG